MGERQTPPGMLFLPILLQFPLFFGGLLGCPGSDWAEAGASCYHRSSQPMSWREGNDYCQQQGGFMVEVNSEPEQQLITGMYGSENYHWIGLTDWSGEWRWRHSHEAPSYTNWGPNQPDSADQHCAFLWGAQEGKKFTFYAKLKQMVRPLSRCSGWATPTPST